MSSERLSVWYEQELVAELGRKETGYWWLRYTREWMDRPGFPVSPPLGLDQELHQDAGDPASVRWFFENLLPEEGVKKQIARRLGVRSTDAWALLEHLGGEVAGALAILPSGQDPSLEEELVPLELEDLQKRVEEARKGRPLLVSGKGARLSLAGAQEKMGVRLGTEDSLLEPLGGTASTHILKSENSNSSIVHCPANEWICMQVARAVGLPVPDSHLLRLPNGEGIYVVQRFDRLREPGRVVRLHQIDLCQVLDHPSELKYEGDGGPDVRSLFEALKRTSIPSVAQSVCLRWILFNYLIGNDDAHAKNVSFLLDEGQLTVAPFYDLLCVQAYYPAANPAMSIGGVFEPGHLRREEWEMFAAEIDVGIVLVKEELSRLSARLPDEIDTALGADVLEEKERAWFRAEALPRILQRIAFARVPG